MKMLPVFRPPDAPPCMLVFTARPTRDPEGSLHRILDSAARIDVEHSTQRGWFRVHDVAHVQIAGPVEDTAAVTCVIPGHHQVGRELIAERLEAHIGPLAFDFSGRCGYRAPFDYRGPIRA